MVRQQLKELLLFGIPQSITGVRLVLGVWSLFVAVLGESVLAATLIVVGVLTDGLDGAMARRLNMVSEFGARFDYLVDFLCYVIVPAVLSLSLLKPAPSFLGFVLLGFPVLIGAIRYARNTGKTMREDFEEVGIPGLPTLSYCFYVISLVFLFSEDAVTVEMQRRTLLFGVAMLSPLMIAPIRYPKIVKHKAVLIPAIVGLNLMPFFFTTFLATLTLALTLVYSFTSPLLVKQHCEVRYASDLRSKSGLEGGKNVTG